VHGHRERGGAVAHRKALEHRHDFGQARAEPAQFGRHREPEKSGFGKILVVLVREGVLPVVLGRSLGENVREFARTIH
jgi:hypothetical protein